MPPARPYSGLATTTAATGSSSTSCVAALVSEPLLLGFDVGTSAVKAAAFTLEGTPVAVTSRQIRLDAPREGICEVDPRDYWDALVACCADLRRERVEMRAVRALAVAANAETLLVMNDRLEPVRPGIVWLDTRSQQEALDLGERFGIDQLARRSGQPQMIPMWPATKMLWLRRHEPETVDSRSLVAAAARLSRGAADRQGAERPLRVLLLAATGHPGPQLVATDARRARRHPRFTSRTPGRWDTARPSHHSSSAGSRDRQREQWS